MSAKLDLIYPEGANGLVDPMRPLSLTFISCCTTGKYNYNKPASFPHVSKMVLFATVSFTASDRDLQKCRYNGDYEETMGIREEITSFEGPIDWSDNYGTRIHGFIMSPETGLYTFWIAGDDNSELWLSRDHNPVFAAKIADVQGWTKSRQWGKYRKQQSNRIILAAGQAYYIMVLHKEGIGGDNIVIAWEMEGSCKDRQVISGSCLLPYETDIPKPNPMTWAIMPYPTSSTSISMTATLAFDRSGIEYYFTSISAGGHDSSWQDSPSYEDKNLEQNTVYTYTVTARDKNPNQNTTTPSQPSSARTFLAGDLEPDGMINFIDYARLVLHWLETDCGECGSSDLTADGKVNFNDLKKLVED